MLRVLFSSRHRAYRGSRLLSSTARRMMGALLPVALIWALAGWALQWW
ncbi:MAG: hypothetical protein WC284_11720 [Candidimonas sp.]